MLTEIVSGSPSQMLRVGLGTKRLKKVKSVACFSAFASILYFINKRF